jgi:hypothetical protein
LYGWCEVFRKKTVEGASLLRSLVDEASVCGKPGRIEHGVFALFEDLRVHVESGRCNEWNEILKMRE